MILVAGATGLLGGTISRKLLQEGKDVRILVRHDSPAAEMAKQGLATPAQTLIDAGASPIYGDLKDRPSLDRACAGVETVISTANSVLRGGADNLESVDLHGTKSLIAAAKDAGVRHFVYVSAIGAQIDDPSPLFHAKGVCEGDLKKSGMAYTILQPGFSMEIWIGAVVGAPVQAGLPVTLVGKGDNRHAFVALQDVADYAVTAVDHPAAQDAVILVGGQEAYSWNEVVQTTGEVLGQALAVNYVAASDPVPLLPEAMTPLLVGMEHFESYIDMRETSARFGIEPTSLPSFSAGFFGRAAETA